MILVETGYAQFSRAKGTLVVPEGQRPLIMSSKLPVLRDAQPDRSNAYSDINPARVTIEPPEGWCPGRILLTRLRHLGYEVQEHIVLGEHLFVMGPEPLARKPTLEADGH